MSQRQHNRTLYWEDEEHKAGSTAIDGEHFWRSVWKRIENSPPGQARAHSRQAMSIEPPRDYVVDAEQGLYW